MCPPSQKNGEKRYEIQGGSQEMAVIVSLKNFNIDNSGEFGAKTKGH